MALQIRRGTASSFAAATCVLGELLYVTDTKKLYVGSAGTTKNYIGSARRTEWAQCINTLTEDVCTATPVSIIWDTTASNVNVSDTSLYTVAAAGITVSYAGTYEVECSAAATGASSGTSKVCKCFYTIAGASDGYEADMIRYQTTYANTNWSRVLTLTAGQQIGVVCMRGTGHSGDADIIAGKATLKIKALEVDY